MSSKDYQLRVYSAGAVTPPLQEVTDLFEKDLFKKIIIQNVSHVPILTTKKYH